MPPLPLGNMEAVATSKTPHPQAQAWTIPGVKTPANTPLPIFTAELNFFFILNLKLLEGTTAPPKVKVKRKNFVRANGARTTHGEGIKRRNGAAAASAVFAEQILRRMYPAGKGQIAK